ncbi:hypothetical protein C477_15405 [Haloterrigena salina JCM 13891]|uniref:DUF2249 domain-containing protein n=1 Tax=Haloterrigena salina JCM 13891 TaxID=1227488 RepID=M0BZI7_9EURY|nr:DUF2249 domain-containing protein [Haloterrigena salina]ELZ16431.1 hypothetical protein C477_15405 [Haloterrigena salina JCM 13891]
MQSPETVVDGTNAPSDRPRTVIDVRSLGPPEPLKNTLEKLVELPDETVLVQRNDRVPQFLFPKLEDRGYAYETVEGGEASDDSEGRSPSSGRTQSGDEVVTVIWRP